MKTFHHGGRLGDCIYALYTVKALSALKAEIIISDYHQGNWTPEMRAALLPLLRYQSYIDSAKVQGYSELGEVDYDLQKAEDDFNPRSFPEWKGPNWPGNCHIAKRYAEHFDVEFYPEAVWLTAPRKKEKEVDVVVHAPRRRCTDYEALNSAVAQLHLAGYKVAVIDFEQDWSLATNVIKPANMLETADYINSAKVFIGSVSSCACIAEGLKKWRLVQVAENCDNTCHAGRTGKNINGWSGDQIADISKMIIKHG